MDLRGFLFYFLEANKSEIRSYVFLRILFYFIYLFLCNFTLQ